MFLLRLVVRNVTPGRNARQGNRSTLADGTAELLSTCAALLRIHQLKNPGANPPWATLHDERGLSASTSGPERIRESISLSYRLHRARMRGRLRPRRPARL